MTQAQVNSIDDLLDGTLDDLADIPAFKPFPIGAHKLKLNFAIKPVGGVSAIELKMTIVESVELKDPEQEAPKPGDNSNVLFMLKNKDGTPNELAQGQFKNLMATLAPAFPEATNNREIMTAAEGIEVLGSTGQRVDKNDKTKVYTTLENVVLL